MIKQVFSGRMYCVYFVFLIVFTGVHCRKNNNANTKPHDRWEPVSTNKHRNIGEANWSFAINHRAFFGSKNGDLYIFDFSKQDWVGSFSYPDEFEPRWACAVAVHNKKAYIGNGRYGNGQFLQDSWEFDPDASHPWRRLPNSPIAAADGIAFVHDGKLHTTLHVDEISGNSSKQQLIYSYDITNETWDNDHEELTVHCGTNGFSFLLNDKLYFGAGYNNSLPGSIFTREAAVYNPVTKQTASIASFPVEMQRAENAISFTHDNKGYVLGKNRELFEYNPAINRWREMNKVPELANQGPVTYVHRYNNKVYGFTTSGYLFEYIPE